MSREATLAQIAAAQGTLPRALIEDRVRAFERTYVARDWHGRAALESVGWFTIRTLIVTSLIMGTTWSIPDAIQFFTITVPQWIGSNLGVGPGNSRRRRS